MKFAVVAISWFASASSPALSCDPQPSAFPEVMVAEHNAYRREVGLASLSWSADLACAAQQWATHLAAVGGRSLTHSPAAERNGAGENLWRGTAGGFRYRDMVDRWGAERSAYSGAPVGRDNVSAVGHYTQMVWRETEQLGCGIATGGGDDVLVCRYQPAGNIAGRRPF